MNDYALALRAGSARAPTARCDRRASCTDYTGLPVDYVMKANLRINGGEFEKKLQTDAGLTTGRLDTRFSGPDVDPLARRRTTTRSPRRWLRLCLGLQRLRAQGPRTMATGKILQAVDAALPLLGLCAPGRPARGLPCRGPCST